MPVFAKLANFLNAVQQQCQLQRILSIGRLQPSGLAMMAVHIISKVILMRVFCLQAHTMITHCLCAGVRVMQNFSQTCETCQKQEIL